MRVTEHAAGDTFVHFSASPRLWGVLLWGRPGRQDALDLRKSLVRELAPDVEPHVSIVDATGLTGADVGAFEELSDYVETSFEALSRAVTRLALVRPAGMEGALVAGMFHVMPRPYPVEVFEELRPALAWLAEQDRSLIELEQSLPAALEQLFRARTETAPIVYVLRGYLDRNLAGANVGDAARALSVSLRTLQRRLSEAETTFHEELAKARLAAAQRLMLDSDAPLTTIALEVGCPSLQYFSALFRRQTGQSPSAWRSSRRASSAEGGGR